MANYISALGRMASEKVSGAGSDFVKGLKGAFMAEVPALSAASGFKSSLQKYSQDAESAVKEQKINNVISLEMVRQLRAVNSNIVTQTRFAAKAEQRAQQTAAFSEETEREKIIRDDRLLKAIQKIGASNDAAYRGNGKGIVGQAADSLLEKFGITAAGSAVGTAAGGMIGRLAPIVGRLLMNPYVLGAIAAAVGAIVLFKNVNQDKKGKVGFGAGDAMNDAINYGGMTPPSGGGGGGGGPAAPGGAGGGAATNAGTQATSNIKWNVPIEGPFRITSPYGVQRSTGTHKGIDLAPADNTVATFAIAAADGTVIEVASRGGYGNYVIISHSEGYSTYYAHLNNYKFAKGLYKGLRIRAGTRVGIVGNTGRSRGTHLHFEIRKNGTAVDPAGIVPGLSGGNKQSEVAKTTGNSGDYANATQAASAGGDGGPTSRGGSAKPAAAPSSNYIEGYTSFEERQRNAIGLITPGGGTPESTYMKGYISPADRLQIKYLNLILRSNQQVAKNTKDANVAAGIRPGGITRGGSQRAATTDPFTRYYQSRIKSIAQQFENTTRSLINTTLTNVLFPGKFFGVSRRQAEQPGYLGNLITKELELQKKMTPFFNKLLGRRFGGQYASLFSQAGGLLLDRGANAFGAMLGFDSKSPFGFGQIVGNLLTKGRQGKEARKLGMEQLIYSMTGIPLGAQSGLAFLQKTFPSFFGPMAGGYMTPQQQIAAMTGSTMGMLQPGMMFGQTLAGGMNMIPGSAAQMQMAMLSRPTTYDGTRMTMDTAALAKVQAAESAYISETQTQAQQGFFENLGDTFSAGFSGLFKILGFGGGPGGGSFMNFGGGGTGGGGFFSNLATTGTNMLAMYGGYKLMQKIGGKNQNPVVTMLGTIALSQGLKIGAGMALDALGYGAVAKTLGLPTALPSFGGATTGITGGGIGSAGAAETGLTAAGGVADSAAAYSASLGEFGVVPGFGASATGTTAALQASQGTQAAAAFAEANAAPAAAAGAEGFLAAAAETIPIVAAVYAVYRIINYFAFEKGDTRATYSIYIKGNNDINAGEIVHIEKAGDGQLRMVESFGKAAFVMVKKLEAQAGVKPDFDYISVQISVKPHRNVQMGFNNGTPGKGDRKNTPIAVGPFDVRQPITEAVIKVIMDNMAKLIAERMSKSSAKAQSELESSLKTITKPEMAGDIEGLDKNTFKDTAGRTSYNESIAARATPEFRTEISGDSSSDVATGNMSVFNAKTGQYQIVSGESGILGFDANGNPITSASLSSASASPSSATTVASGTSLTYQQQQAANEQLKNSNPTTAAQNGGKSTAVVNSGNQIDNSSKTTVINTSLRDEGYMFGAFRQSEFDRFSVAA